MRVARSLRADSRRGKDAVKFHASGSTNLSLEDQLALAKSTLSAGDSYLNVCCPHNLKSFIIHSFVNSNLNLYLNLNLYFILNTIHVEN